MRNTVAQAALTALLLASCADSHGRLGDAGRMNDGGPLEVDAAIRDAGMLDAGPRSTCDADDAQAQICPAAVCDGLPRWYWNGDDCFSVDCGACIGADCARGVSSEAECLAAHASCVSALCRATGGEWRFWAEDCGHFVCGYAPPEDCEVGAPSCDCGAFRSFDPTRGCFDDTTCPVPEPVTREALCTSTRGTWGGFCCDSVCGAGCPEPCAQPACDCGPGRIFEDARGCIESVRCHEPRREESCEGEARCEEGTICCEHCGGAGCFGPPTCEAPLCDDDPDVDECGNDLLAP